MSITQNILKPVFTSCCLASVVACSGSNVIQQAPQTENTTVDSSSNLSTTTDTTETDPVVTGQTTSPVTGSTDYQLNIKFKGDLLDGVISDGTVKFTVWGYDKFVADVQATELVTSTQSIKPLSETYALQFSAADLATVEYQSGGEGSLGYYLTFYIDVDGDGRKCNGDYRQDYELSDQAFFNSTDYQIDMVIAVTLVTNENCAGN